MWSTLVSCIIFGFVSMVISLAFYAVSLNRQYVRMAYYTAAQSRQNVTRGSDATGLSKTVMDIYNSLSEEDRAKNGTAEYRELFSEVDISGGSVYDTVYHIMKGALSNSDLYDVYIGMYDVERCRLVYIVDADTNEETKMYPGDWEEIDEEGMQRLLENKNDEILYNMDYSEKYGLLCTVALPIRDKAGEIVSFMLVDISAGDVVKGLIRFFIQLFIVTIIATLIIAMIRTRNIERYLVYPINRIADAAGNYVREKNSDSSAKEHFAGLDIHTGDEIENLSLTMAQMEKDLYDYEQDLTAVTRENERIGTELSLARQIQASMMPDCFPPFPERSEFDIYATMEPAKEIGGDFYDFLLIDEDHLGIFIADVSGKGIPAALFMMASKIILQSCATLGKEYTAAEILERTNKAICDYNKMEMFVTVWIGILEISSGRMNCANAGHEYPAIRRSGGDFELYTDKHGFVIGGMKQSRYYDYTLELNPGDRLFLYTDGVPEAADDDCAMFGTGRMLEALNKDPDAPLEKVLANVRSDVSEFVKGAEQFDDITMVCFEYHGA